jgi:hypothetical protein
MERLNTFVDFRGDFPKPEFPPDRPYGAEVAALIAEGLTRRRFTVAEVEESDIEWIVHCDSGDFRYRAHVWIDLEEMDRWEVCCPSPVGWLRRLCGTTDREEHKRLLLGIHGALEDGPGVRDIRWFEG